MPLPVPEPPAGEPETVSFTAAGYAVAAHLEHEATADGPQTYRCRLVATPLADQANHPVVVRTLVLSREDAELGNSVRPGFLPPANQLNAGLLALGERYIQMLLDAVNRGFRDLAPTGTHSASEVRARLGMTDTALRARER
jgi:hypothetical protein